MLHHHIIPSPHPNITIPHQTLVPVLFEHAPTFHNHTAIVCDITGRNYTYAELTSAIRHVAAGLTAHGIRKGDVVGLVSPSHPEVPVVFCAVLSIGAICSTAACMTDDGWFKTGHVAAFATHRRRRHAVHRYTRVAVQKGAAGGVCKRDSEVALGEDAAPSAGGAGAGKDRDVVRRGREARRPSAWQPARFATGAQVAPKSKLPRVSPPHPIA